MTTPMMQPVPANEPVTIAPVVKLTLWQRLRKWLEKWLLRVWIIGAFPFGLVGGWWVAQWDW